MREGPPTGDAAGDVRRPGVRQRAWLAERLERGKQGLERYARALVDAVRLDAAVQVDRVRGQVDQLAARIRGAASGGNADKQRRVYEHDIAIGQRVAAVADRLESLGEPSSHSAETLALVARELLELSDAWDERDDLLRG